MVDSSVQPADAPDRTLLGCRDRTPLPSRQNEVRRARGTCRVVVLVDRKTLKSTDDLLPVHQKFDPRTSPGRKLIEYGLVAADIQFSEQSDLCTDVVQFETSQTVHELRRTNRFDVGIDLGDVIEQTMGSVIVLREELRLGVTARGTHSI
jgi:hypothetical protein